MRRAKAICSAPVSEVKSLGDGQVAARLLLLELASVGPLEQVGVRRSGDESDDVEAEDDPVCVWFWSTVSEGTGEGGDGKGKGRKSLETGRRLTSEVVVRLVLRPVDVRRGESTQVTDSDLECG